MSTYCKKEKVDRNNLCFSFGSISILPTDNPISLGLQDGDIILAQTF